MTFIYYPVVKLSSETAIPHIMDPSDRRYLVPTGGRSVDEHQIIIQ